MSVLSANRSRRRPMAQARLSNHARREHGVALVDDVLDVADQMGQANLMVALGPARLAAQRSDVQ